MLARLCLAAVIGIWPLVGLAVDPFLDWRTLTSDHFNLHYHEGEAELAQRVLRIAERVHDRLSKPFHWEPASRTELVLSDETDRPNGFSMPLPRNTIRLYTTPPNGVSALSEFDDWYELLLIHEYTHLLHLDKAHGAPAGLRKGLGRHLLTFPNLFQPRLMLEGIATYYETDVATGVGRGRNSIYAMMMRAETAKGVRPFDKAAMDGVAEWPLGEMPYLYGVHFYQFLAERYGTDKPQRVIGSYSNNLVPFLVHSNFRQALGRDTPALWQEFQQYLQSRYRPQIDAVAAAGEVTGQRSTRHGWWTGPARALPDGGVLYVRNDGLAHPRLMHRRPGGETEALAEVQADTRFDWHPEAGIVLAQPDVVDNEYVYYDLHHLDPDSGRSRRLTEGGRYRYAAWSPDGDRLAAVTGVRDRTALVLLDAHGNPRQRLWQGRPGELLADPDWSPDGSAIVASVKRPGGSWNLERFTPATGRWETLTRDDGIEGQPQYAADGSLLYTADRSGVFNLYRLDPATGATQAITNVTYGAFTPSAAGGQLWYVGYGPDGYDLYRLPVDATARPPQLAHYTAVEADKHAPGALVDEPTVAEPVPYSPWPTLGPTAWSPILFASEDVAQLGLATSGEDALGAHAYAASLSHEFQHGYTAGSLAYNFHNRIGLALVRSFSYGFNESELVRTRRTDQWQVLGTLPWYSLDRTVALHAGASGVDEEDVFRETGFVGESDSLDQVVGAALSYDSARVFPRSISRSDGRSVRLVAETSERLESDYSGDVYSLDWREFVALPARHVLGVRLAGGWGTEFPRPFNLGGAFADDGALLLNRRRYPLRGYPSGLNGMVGRRFRLASLEWRLPLLTVERAFRRPPVGLHQLSGALFADNGAAWHTGSAPKRDRTGVGFELTADTNLFYLLNLQLTLGYAHGRDEDGEDQLYLRLGSGF